MAVQLPHLQAVVEIGAWRDKAITFPLPLDQLASNSQARSRGIPGIVRQT